MLACKDKRCQKMSQTSCSTTHTSFESDIRIHPEQGSIWYAQSDTCPTGSRANLMHLMRKMPHTSTENPSHDMFSESR